MSRKAIYYEYNRKGQVEAQYEDKWSLSWADVLTALVLTFGPVVMMQFYTQVLTDPDVRRQAEVIAQSALGVKLPSEVANYFKGLLGHFKAGLLL